MNDLKPITTTEKPICILTPVPDYFIHNKIDELNSILDKIEIYISNKSVEKKDFTLSKP